MENNILLEKRIAELEAENLQLKQQQIDSSKAKELYLKIFEEFPALIWRSRLDKLCDYFNKTWYDFTGRTYEKEFGNGWAESVHPEDFDRCLEIYVSSFDKREAFVMEYRMLDKFSRYRWIRDFGRPFYDLDNTFLGYIGSCYDITDRKENEIQLELNATKDKFFSIIAHDLKNPFGALLCFSEYMFDAIQTDDKEKLMRCAKTISSVVHNTYNLLENLLEWSQLQRGSMQANIQHHSINEIINECITLMKESAIRKEISISCKTSDILYVNCDKEMTKAVIRNLISNAIKFSHTKGYISIDTTKNAEYVTVTIRDNGVGISNENIQHLFKVAKNNSTPGTTNEKGTGLGLVLCKEFIQLQGGTIWVESEIDKGSKFHFTVPIA